MKHTIKGFDGHIILYCKSHYTCSSGYINGLRMIWCIRCGLQYTKNDKSIDRYIANKLYSIIQQYGNITRLQEVIHEEMDNTWRYKDYTSLEILIHVYMIEISNLQVKEKINNKWKSILILPKPMKRVFNRILRGNGRYEDYWLVEPKS